MKLAPLVALVALPAAHADEIPTPTWGWALTQILPSPGLQIDDGGAAFAMRWQLTPLLYSFGVRTTPWRALVAEPMVRYGGSVELFVDGEYTGRGDFADRWGVRTGARLYLPLLQHGENLALSFAASHIYAHREHGMGIELGTYVLYGILGLQVTYSPPLPVGESVTLHLSIRFF